MKPMKTLLILTAIAAVAFSAAVAAAPISSVPGFAVDATTIDASAPFQDHNGQWRNCVGIEAYATGPFRYKAFDINANTTSVLAPVDTTFMYGAITAGAVKYPVVLTLHAPLDSIRFVPAGSDTVWYKLLYE